MKRKIRWVGMELQRAVCVLQIKWNHFSSLVSPLSPYLKTSLHRKICSYCCYISTSSFEAIYNRSIRYKREETLLPKQQKAKCFELLLFASILLIPSSHLSHFPLFSSFCHSVYSISTLIALISLPQ